MALTARPTVDSGLPIQTRHVEANVRHLESIDTYDTVDSESTEVLCLNYKNERCNFLL